MTELLNELFETSRRRMRAVSASFSRSAKAEIRWTNRLIGIRGARGVGKTTMILQQMKELSESGLKPDELLYISMDNMRMQASDAVTVIHDFIMNGGQYLFLDEVHKYDNWSVLIKNLYDDYPELKIVFTGSSLLNLLDARADLSRRARMYDLPGLSFREYLDLTGVARLPLVTLEEVLSDHQRISADVLEAVKPLAHFDRYLRTGYYPFFMEDEEGYADRVNEIINYVLGAELTKTRKVEVSSVPKIAKLLVVIAESAPFVPNVSKLSEVIGVTRNTFVEYLNCLADAKFLNLMYRDSGGASRLRKPDKIYLENPTLGTVLAGKSVNSGTARETFFFNQLSNRHKVEFAESGDFVVDGKFTFEVGGRNKGKKQIEGIENGYLALDGIESGAGNRIPLWLFGFLY